MQCIKATKALVVHMTKFADICYYYCTYMAKLAAETIMSTHLYTKNVY